MNIFGIKIKVNGWSNFLAEQNRSQTMLEDLEHLKSIAKKSLLHIAEENQRRAVSLYYIGGLSFDEIGEKLDLERSSVKSYITRGKDNILENVTDELERRALETLFAPNSELAGINKKIKLVKEKMAGIAN